VVRGTNAAEASAYTGWYTICQRSPRSTVLLCAAFVDTLWYTICQQAGWIAGAHHGIATHSAAASGPADCSAALHQLVPSRGGRSIRRGLRHVARPERQRAPLAPATLSGAPLSGDGTHVHWLRTRCSPRLRSARRGVPWRSHIPSASSRSSSIARGPPSDAGDRETGLLRSRKEDGGWPAVIAKRSRPRAY
jgi:hypothetical protein